MPLLFMRNSVYTFLEGGEKGKSKQYSALLIVSVLIKKRRFIDEKI